MSSITPLTPNELGQIAGPLLISHFLNWGLFGVLSLQVCLYYLAFPKDRTAYKFLVFATYLLEAAQTFLSTASAFQTFAYGFGNPASLDEVGVLWFSAPLMSGMAAFLSQTFYAYRITVLARSYHLAGLIMLLAFFSLAGSIALAVETKKAVVFSHIKTILKKGTFTSAAIWEAGSAACDVLIAGSMIYYLKSREMGIKQTQVLLAKIIRLTIETGTLTAALAIISLILTFLPGSPTYYQTSVSVLGKVYTNSMMVAFNSRMKIGSSNSTATEVHELPTASHGTRKRSDVELAGRMRTGGVVVTREEMSFPPSNDTLQDNKRRFDDIYSAAPFKGLPNQSP